MWEKGSLKLLEIELAEAISKDKQLDKWLDPEEDIYPRNVAKKKKKDENDDFEDEENEDYYEEEEEDENPFDIEPTEDDLVEDDFPDEDDDMFDEDEDDDTYR